MSQPIANILILDHFNQIGGGQLYILDILNRVDPTRFRVFTIDSPVKKIQRALRESRATILPIRFGGWKDLVRPWRLFLAFIRLVSAVSKHRIDIVHTNTVWCQCVALAVALFRRRPILWNYHDMAQFDTIGRWFRILLAFAANRIVVPSRASARKLGAFPNKIVVVPNGFDLNTFKPTLRCGKNERFAVAWIGRLIPWKNVELLLYATHLLKRKGADLECHIYGSGKPVYLAKIRSLADELGIRDMFFFNGHVDDIREQIVKSDLIVNTSKEPESFGRTLIEAALCKKAVVATSLGASQEVIVHNQTGILVPSDSPPDLANAISFLMENPLVTETMADAAFHRARRLFDLKKIVTEIENLYLSILFVPGDGSGHE